MPPKDPRINQVTFTAKVISEPETREVVGALRHTVTKVKVQIAQPQKKNDTWVDEGIPMEVRGWNKTAEKMQALKPNMLVCIQGKLVCDHFEYEGQPRTKV